MSVSKQFMVVKDFHSKEKRNTMEVNGYRQLFGYQHSLVLNRRKNSYRFGTTLKTTLCIMLYITQNSTNQRAPPLP